MQARGWTEAAWPTRSLARCGVGLISTGLGQGSGGEQTLTLQSLVAANTLAFDF